MSATQPISSSVYSKVESYIQKQLQAPDTNGKPNVFQMIDKADISPEAKQQLEKTMVAQWAQLRAGGGAANLTSAQHSFIFDGSVYKALQNLDSGTGSLQDLTSALQARGQRISEVENGTAPTLPPSTPPAQVPLTSSTSTTTSTATSTTTSA